MTLGVPREPSPPNKSEPTEDVEGEERKSSTLDAEYDLLMLSMGMWSESRPV